MSKGYYQNPLLDEVLKKIPRQVEKEVNLQMEIIYRIEEILKHKGWSQTDLAKAMGKKDPEISKWLGGRHNFTIATIARIEAALGEDILTVKRYRKRASGYEQMPVEKRRWLSEKPAPGYGKK